MDYLKTDPRQGSLLEARIPHGTDRRHHAEPPTPPSPFSPLYDGADRTGAGEQRGFESLWVAGRSHIPLTRRFTHPLGEAALTKEYFDEMDPFVTLSAAAAISKQLKLGTAVCLVIQRDTIQTAKLLASLDPVSTGCFLFGIGLAGMPRRWKISAPFTRPAR